MSTSVYNTFQDLYEAVITDCKEASSVTAVVDNVKRWINEGYEKIIFRKHRSFLDQRFVIDLKGKVEDTFIVTNGSSIAVHTGTATLLSGTLELGFKVQGFEEQLEVASISGTAVTLTTTYKGDTNTAATGVLYQRSVILDSSIAEIYQVSHNYFQNPLSNLGPQKIREQALYYPEQYGKGESWAIYGQSNEARRLIVWPPADDDYTLYVDANVYFTPLELAADEPLIPPQFRQILYWYGKMKLFNFHRNTEQETDALANFKEWLAELDGINEVSEDYAKLTISYRRPKRIARARPFDSRYREIP